jgi:GTP-binding protein Era
MNEKKHVGFVTIIARPNVGKSTLLNKLVGQKIAITTNCAQTTRTNIKGIVTDKTSQIIFTDTPGVHKPLHKLGEFLSVQSKKALEDCDLILFLVEGITPPGAGDKWIKENYLNNIKTPVLIVLNKTDLIKDKEKLEANLYGYKKLFEPQNVNVVKISAKTGKNVSVLLDNIKKYLPEGEFLYDEDDVTDQNLRAIASEIIREKIILNTKDEVPHSVAVLIDDYKSEDKIDKIKATIYVATESQKGILIGKKGSMLKKIGTEARLELEEVAQKKVFLELFVKVQKNWTKDPKAMKMLGYEE